MAKAEAIAIDAGGREVRLSNPRKLYFAEAEAAVSKRDLAEYYV
ncbi:MAG: ATP-dependent DNA ligase, partial [Solirubrobacterales bacterium]|nr:ATP-dependent DNA ligase [Solirubrobacterales bacterium]